MGDSRQHAGVAAVAAAAGAGAGRPRVGSSTQPTRDIVVVVERTLCNQLSCPRLVRRRRHHCCRTLSALAAKVSCSAIVGRVDFSCLLFDRSRILLQVKLPDL